MFTQRVSTYPEPAKLAEAQALLMDRVKVLQGRGVRAALSMRAFGDGPALSLGQQFPDLAALDAFRRANRADAAFAAYQAKLRPLQRKPPKIELLEVLSTPPPGPAPSYVQRITTYPAVGSGPQVRALLEERQRDGAAAGVRGALARSVVSADGPIFVVALLFDDLTGLERSIHRNDADPAFQSFVGKLSGLIRQVTSSELFEVIVPFPS